MPGKWVSCHVERPLFVHGFPNRKLHGFSTSKGLPSKPCDGGAEPGPQLESLSNSTRGWQPSEPNLGGQRNPIDFTKHEWIYPWIMVKNGTWKKPLNMGIYITIWKTSFNEWIEDLGPRGPRVGKNDDRSWNCGVACSLFSDKHGWVPRIVMCFQKTPEGCRLNQMGRWSDWINLSIWSVYIYHNTLNQKFKSFNPRYSCLYLVPLVIHGPWSSRKEPSWSQPFTCRDCGISALFVSCAGKSPQQYFDVRLLVTYIPYHPILFHVYIYIYINIPIYRADFSINAMFPFYFDECMAWNRGFPSDPAQFRCCHDATNGWHGWWMDMTGWFSALICITLCNRKIGFCSLTKNPIWSYHLSFDLYI